VVEVMGGNKYFTHIFICPTDVATYG